MDLLIILAVLTGLFWLGYHITGALFAAAFWLFVKLPLAIIVFCLGIACCATLLLIPVGLACFKLTGRILF